MEELIFDREQEWRGKRKRKEEISCILKVKSRIFCSKLQQLYCITLFAHYIQVDDPVVLRLSIERLEQP